MIPTLIITMFFVGIITSRLTNAMVPLLTQMMGLSAMNTTNTQLISSILTIDLISSVVLTILFVVFLGTGPATAGITYIVRNYGREEHIWLWSDTWHSIKSNFKHSIILWIMDLAVFFVMAIAIEFYMNLQELGIEIQ